MAMRAGPVRLASSSYHLSPMGRALMCTSTVAKLLAAIRSGAWVSCADDERASTAARPAATTYDRRIGALHEESDAPILTSRQSRCIYVVQPYVGQHDRAGNEERERRTAHPRAHRTSAAARLRPVQADRLAVPRGAHLPRRFAVSAALSPREARPHRGTLGGEGRAAAAPLLPHHRRRQADAHEPSSQLEGVHGGHQSRGGGVPCLSGTTRSAAAWPRCGSTPRAKPRSWKSSRSTSRTATTSCDGRAATTPSPGPPR